MRKKRKIKRKGRAKLQIAHTFYGKNSHCIKYISLWFKQIHMCTFLFFTGILASVLGILLVVLQEEIADGDVGALVGVSILAVLVLVNVVVIARQPESKKKLSFKVMTSKNKRSKKILSQSFFVSIYRFKSFVLLFGLQLLN